MAELTEGPTKEHVQHRSEKQVNERAMTIDTAAAAVVAVAAEAVQIIRQQDDLAAAAAAMDQKTERS